VRRDGSIFAGRPENMRGGHTTNWNWCSLGICFEGNFETEQMSAEQLSAGKELVSDIKRRYPTIVIGKHSEFGQTACPGKNFPFSDMISGCDIEPEKDAEERPEPDDWAKDACDQAVESGLFVGDGNGNYNWKSPISRQELAVVLARMNNE
jgi:N-acetyl-anhydromuramyl-L-alanine amidase AmpD